MKSKSSLSLTGERCGDLWGLVEFVRDVRNGSNAVKERWCVRGGRGVAGSSSYENSVFFPNDLSVSVAGAGGAMRSSNLFW
jgi:hypothetical protein